MPFLLPPRFGIEGFKVLLAVSDPKKRFRVEIPLRVEVGPLVVVEELHAVVEGSSCGIPPMMTFRRGEPNEQIE